MAGQDNAPARSVGRLVTSAATALRLVRAASPLLPLALIAAALVAGMLAAVEIVYLRNVVANLTVGDEATKPLILFGIAAAARRIVAAMSAQGQQLASEHIERHITQRVLERAIEVPYEELEDPDFRDQMARALDAGRTRAWQLVWSLTTAATTATTSLALIGVLLALAPDLLLPLFGVAVVLLLISKIKARLAYRFAYQTTRSDRARAYLRQALTARAEGKELRLFGAGPWLSEKHRRLFDERIDNIERLAKRRLGAELVGTLLLSATFIFSVALIVRRATRGELDLADAAALAVATHQLTNQLQSFAQTTGVLLESSYLVTDLNAFLARRVAEQVPTTLAGRFERLDFDDVTFTYPQQTTPAIRNLSFSLGAGDVVAVVGANGSGKSTLAKLAVGLHKPDSGTVSIVVDGRRQLVTGPILGLAAAVFQDFACYELSVADNVALEDAEPLDIGNMDRSARTVDALEAVGLEQMVASLSEGTDTLLGRSFVPGPDLSGGQWQRLALARLVYRPNPLVVLDEPTSAADAHAESEFFRRLPSTFPGRTVLLVSHRFASVRQANRILVLDEGNLVESGNHDELMAAAGLYASMYNVQTERLLGPT